MRTKLIFILAIALSTFNANLFAYNFPGGNGEESNPYRIETAEDLQALNEYVGITYQNTHFRLMNDIDLTTYLAGAGNNSGAGWKPIGSNGNKFLGQFHGGGHLVSGLWINRPSSECVGLFGSLGSGGSIDNLGVAVAVDKTISGIQYVGILTGWSEGSVSSCHSDGKVSGTQHIGGLVGYQQSGSINSCYSTAIVSGTSSYIGGLVGWQNTGTLDFCYFVGTVNGIYTGGLIGWQNAGTSNYSYSTGAITGTFAGGLVGNRHAGTINFGYFNTETSGQVSGVGIGLTTGVTGLTTDKMTQPANFNANLLLTSSTGHPN